MFALGLDVSDWTRPVRRLGDEYGRADEGCVSHTDDPKNVGLCQIQQREKGEVDVDPEL